MGTVTQPVVWLAKSTSAHCGQLRDQMATRSPFLTPAASNPWATSRTALPNSPYVRDFQAPSSCHSCAGRSAYLRAGVQNSSHNVLYTTTGDSPLLANRLAL